MERNSEGVGGSVNWSGVPARRRARSGEPASAIASPAAATACGSSEILAALPQVLRESAEQWGCALQPITTHPHQAHALLDLFRVVQFSNIGHIVDGDVEPVALDLGPIPLNEVLAFRHEYGHAYRAYALALRNMLRDSAITAAAERDGTLPDKRDGLAEEAHALRRLARTTWRRPLSTYALSIAGSALPLANTHAEDVVTCAISTLVGRRRKSDPGSAYTYLVTL